MKGGRGLPHDDGAIPDTWQQQGPRVRKPPSEMPLGARGKTAYGVRSSRGFASMSPERRREIAARGGKAAHQQGAAHEFTRDEAKAAGKLGGKTKTGLGTTGNAARTRRQQLEDEALRRQLGQQKRGPADGRP